MSFYSSGGGTDYLWAASKTWDKDVYFYSIPINADPKTSPTGTVIA
jgi:hypothetical protein